MGLIPGLRKSPREGNGNPLQCSCLENPMDSGDQWAMVHSVAKTEAIQHACGCLGSRKAHYSEVMLDLLTDPQYSQIKRTEIYNLRVEKKRR